MLIENSECVREPSVSLPAPNWKKTALLTNRQLMFFVHICEAIANCPKRHFRTEQIKLADCISGKLPAHSIDHIS